MQQISESSSLHATTLHEDALFSRWAIRHAGFVKDGAVDAQAYWASNPRLLFILKEVNATNRGGWDLREFVRDGGRTQTWNNITRWTEGIRLAYNHPQADMHWTQLARISEDRRRKTLRSIAAMNLKKSPGSHTSNTHELHQVAQQDRAFLREQFDLYKPDVVVCCGSSVALEASKILKIPKWQQSSRGVEYAIYNSECTVFSYCHPEARVADQLLFYGLFDSVREISTRKYYELRTQNAPSLP